MTNNPYMDPPEDGDVPTFEGPAEEEEDEILHEDTPVPHITWMCTGVAFKNLTRKGDPHTMEQGSIPDQPTTDASGSLMAGRCSDCESRTIWKKVTL